MKKIKNYQKDRGFIALFFILGISFTFLTWISLSSERVFEYVRIKGEFVESRSTLHDIILCADAFINIEIGSRYNLTFPGNTFEFRRNLYYDDDFLCRIDSISASFENSSIKTIFFKIGNFGFEYRFQKGFVNSIKSFNLF